MNHFLCGHPLRSVLHSHASQRFVTLKMLSLIAALWCWPRHRGWIFLLCLRLDAMIDTCLLRAVMTRVVRQQASNWVTLRVKFSVSNTPNAHLVGVWCQQGHRSAQHCLSSQSVAQRHSCSCVYSPPLSHHSCCFSTASISSSDITCL